MSRSEPEVVRNLKVLLAKNICNCKICSDHENPFVTHNNDKQIQAINRDDIDTMGQNVTAYHRTKSQKSEFCPGCYMALNLCHQKEFKILKDVESETEAEMFNFDKSTELLINVAEKSTSDTITTEIKNAADSLTKDFLDYQTVSNNLIDYHKTKNKTIPLIESQGAHETIPIYSNCLCMTNFINSIRPPLSNI